MASISKDSPNSLDSSLDPPLRSKLIRALSMDTDYSERKLMNELLAKRAGSPLKEASVLFVFAEGKGGDPFLLLTRRTQEVQTHKGQIAFPGGAKDPTDPNLSFTALRETEEEVGVRSTELEILGALPSLWTVSDYWVTPFVSVARPKLEEIELRPNLSELDRAFWVPLQHLLDSNSYRLEEVVRGKNRFHTHVYYFNDGEEHRIWGATGAMIKNLLDRLQTLS